MKKYAVIVAGGNGTRMNNPVPKQFLLLNGKPVLYYTINTFLRSFDDLTLIVVLPEDSMPAGQKIIETSFGYDRILVTPGGATRFHSVQNGLKLINEESIVFVHDAVRCLVSIGLIHRCEAAAREYGSAIPVVESKDSVRLLTAGGNETIDRTRVKLVQTPQTFQSRYILPAYNIDYNEQFTDEATVAEASGFKVRLVQGDIDNIKITRPSDLEYVAWLLSKN